jgi:hypothetical protein
LLRDTRWVATQHKGNSDKTAQVNSFPDWGTNRTIDFHTVFPLSFECEATICKENPSSNIG